MDMGMIQTVMDWIQDNVGDRTSKQDLMSKAQGSNLPPEADEAIREMPEGEHSKQDVMSMLQQKLSSKVGAGVGGGLGGMTGGFGR